MKITIWIIGIAVLLIAWSVFAAKFLQKRMITLPSNKTMTMNTWTKNWNTKLATFAWGCFRCMQPAFDETPWVIETFVGYVGWDESTATYEKVGMGQTKHREWIQITYDPSVVSYETLLETYRKQIDPTDPDGQFADKWFHYTTAIYAHDEEQAKLAELSKKLLADSNRYMKPIVTVIIPYAPFFPAEEYHQKYYTKASVRYAAYKKWSGREARVKNQDDLEIFDNQNEESLDQLDAIEDDQIISHSKSEDTNEIAFVKPDKEKLKKTLTPLQYKVTQENGTERPFDNEYHDNKREEIYIDIVSGEPLFTSFDKYDSGTGRPSFTKPIGTWAVTLKVDKSLWSTRTEVRSTFADSHLGHVFDDGPKDRGGMRYCMNSAAMAFVPIEDMEKRGYGKYLELFNN